MALQKDNKLAWGITLLLFGFLFLLKQINIFPPEVANFIFDFKNYPLIIGIIFLLTYNNKNVGLILIIIGILFRLSDIIRITQHIANYIWPLLLIIAGAILVAGNRKK